MKKMTYTYPKSSFLSTEKDLEIITDMIMKNDNLKRMLYYTSRDCLNKPALTEDQTLEMFGKHIKLVPKLKVDKDVLNYLFISLDNFTTSENPEFRNNFVEFDILCHYDQWHLQDYQLRPYRIAAELDSIFKNQRLTGIGKLEFLGGNQINVNNEFGGFCLIYRTVHGEEDSKFMPNPMDEEQFIENFNAMFNE